MLLPTASLCYSDRLLGWLLSRGYASGTVDEMDLTQITTTLGLFKTGFDTLRTAMGLVKDVQGVLPEGEKKDLARS